MTTWNQLSRPLRLVLAAPWLLLTALAGMASVPAFRALMLDPADQPTADVSLTSPHWTGTLDAARLPAGVPTVHADGDLYLQPGTGNRVSFCGPDGTARAYLDGNLGSSLVFVDGAGSIYFGNGAARLSYAGNTLFSNVPLTVQDNLQVYSLTDINGNLVLDTNGGLFAGGNQIADSNGDLFANEYLVASEGSLYAGGYQIADASGDLLAAGAISGNSLFINQGMSVWGATPPVSQPATPTTLAEVVTLLQSYGLCQ